MIQVQISADSKYPFDRKMIRQDINLELAKHGISDGVELSLSVVGKRKMASLNQAHMGKEGPTDVLSFPLNDPSNNQPFVSSPDGVLRLGDIVVCYPVAQEYAISKQKMIDDVISDLTIHGLLHLLGIHHD